MGWLRDIRQMFSFKRDISKLQQRARGSGIHYSDSNLTDIADAEMEEASRAVEHIYFASMDVLLADQAVLKSAVLGGILEDVNDTYLFGVLLEVASRSVGLPTSPGERARLHLLRHFLNYNELSLDESRERVARCAHVVESGDEIATWLVASGRRAHASGDPTLLLECHREIGRSLG
ncbi:MAG: hypothetical protein ACO1OG_05695 [Devosia sp.]